MGGQACVFYGAAEFSRDTDFAILADAANLARLRQALAELRAEPIAVPPFELKYLRRGHAVHFRCQHPEALADARGRDVKNARRGGFRQTLETADNFATSRRRQLRFAIAARLGAGQENATRQGLADDPPAGRGELFWEPQKAAGAQIRFWLAELRTTQLLVEVARKSRSRGNFPANARCCVWRWRANWKNSKLRWLLRNPSSATGPALLAPVAQGPRKATAHCSQPRIARMTRIDCNQPLA